MSIILLSHDCQVSLICSDFNVRTNRAGICFDMSSYGGTKKNVALKMLLQRRAKAQQEIKMD